VAIEALGNHILAGENRLVMECLEQLRRSRGVGVQGPLRRARTCRASRRIGVRPPRLGQEQACVQQRRATGGGRGRTHPDVPVLHCAPRATLLPGHAHRVRPLLGNARLIEDDDPPGSAQIVFAQLMRGPAHLLFVPDRRTDEALHGPHVTSLDLQGDGRERLAVPGTALPDQVANKVVPRCGPRKALLEARMKLGSLLDEAFDIPRGQGQWGKGELCSVGPTCRYHSLPPVA
jgi:hypothetical protein